MKIVTLGPANIELLQMSVAHLKSQEGILHLLRHFYGQKKSFWGHRDYDDSTKNKFRKF